MLWIKTLHLAALVCWCGALLCVVAGLVRGGRLPAAALSVADPDGSLADALRPLFLLIATPAALLAIVAGTALFPWVGPDEGWLAAKLMAVVVLSACHLLAGWALLKQEAHVQQDDALPLPSTPVVMLAGLTLVAMLGTLWLVLAKPG